MILTARDLVAHGYSRSAAYRILAAHRAPDAPTALREIGSGARRRVLALALPDATAPMVSP